VQLKAIAPGNKIPQGLLSQGPAAIQNGMYLNPNLVNSYADPLITAVGHFLAAKEMDRINEKRPAGDKDSELSKLEEQKRNGSVTEQEYQEKLAALSKS